ncbi:hypothetical protein N7493_003813 [Penicillium malachiteum]|uniref:pH-response regulator protein palC n=1 Tax=Penicillium malachiteum TaxID=1324776 RepID=A0AAD6HQC9_9EURO|nr:hypothetical protein N7493_003813 [Penicillium malachiteum]
MVYDFTLPTTSPLSFQTFISSPTHPSLPQLASTARYGLYHALRAHKRLPRGPRQDAHLQTVLSELNKYIPLLFAISHGLTGRPVRSTPPDGGDESSTQNPRSGEEIEITVHAEIESAWKPTLSSRNTHTLNLGSTSTPGNATNSKGLSKRGKRVSGRGINFEIGFTLTTLGYVLSQLGRVRINETLYATQTQTTEQRVAGIQTATRHLLDAGTVHTLLASSPSLTGSTTGGSGAPDIDPTTQSALASLALAEGTLVAVLKDDAYVAACIQERNPNDKEWMVKAPEIPKVRALLFARLCVRAAEYAEQASTGLGSVGSGKNGRLDEEFTRYAEVLSRVARARACRFFGINAELAAKTGEGIAWLRAARTALGLRSTGATPAPARVDGKAGGKKIEKSAGGAGRRDKGPLEPGDDAGREEEGRVITMLETKWVRMNDTMNTQPIPPSGPLLSKFPSGRDIHSVLRPYKPASLDEDQLMRMRAPPEETEDASLVGNDPDSDDEDIPVDARGLPGGLSVELPDRTKTASTYY